MEIVNLRLLRMVIFAMLIFTFALPLLGGCGTREGKPEAVEEEGQEAGEELQEQLSITNNLQNVKYWAYQLQNFSGENNLLRLINSRYDLLVIDQNRSVKGQESYDDKSDVARLKKSKGYTGEGKLVVCYLNVGEAESYRWYWQEWWRLGNPEWIVAPDPDGWDENYPVKYWRAEWKEIVRRCLERILEDGYDGVYLDWLQAYSFEPVSAAARREGLDPQLELMNFLRELADYSRSRKPGFIFIAQNAVYAQIFDGVAQEAIWFDGGGDPDSGEIPGDVPVDSELTAEYLSYLSKWQQKDKPVFNVEYARNPTNVQRAYQLGSQYGLRTYVTLTELDELTSTPPPGL